MTGFLPALLASLAVATVLAWLMRRVGIVDMPNARSSHATPTPRGGGLAVMTGFAAGLILLTVDAPAVAVVLAGCLVCGLLAAMIGLLDDLFTLSEGLKFIALLALSLVLAGVSGPVDWFLVPLPGVIGLAGSALFLFVLINGANFMDGSDGMLVVLMGPPLIGLALLDAGVIGASAALLAAALAGFGLFNAPVLGARGSLFAGDAGSLGLAMVTGGLMLAFAAQDGPSRVFLVAILVLPLLSDVLLTLAARAKGKANLLKAHRCHAYQLLIRLKASHRQVALIYAGLGWACVALAWSLSAVPSWAQACGFVIAVTALGLGHRQVRRRAAAAGEDVYN